MKILALDPAEKCGWALDNNIFGTWDLRAKRDESQGMKLIRFRAKLIEVHKIENLGLIVFERPGGRFKTDIISHSKFQAVIETFCIENGIQFKGYSPKEIKKFATGNGNCNKAHMVGTAKEKLGYQGGDHNEADALWLLNLANSELNI